MFWYVIFTAGLTGLEWDQPSIYRSWKCVSKTLLRVCHYALCGIGVVKLMQINNFHIIMMNSAQCWSSRFLTYKCKPFFPIFNQKFRLTIDADNLLHPSCFSGFDSPSSTIVNHYQPSSTIINHHQPSKIIKNNQLFPFFIDLGHFFVILQPYSK